MRKSPLDKTKQKKRRTAKKPEVAGTTVHAEIQNDGECNASEDELRQGARRLLREAVRDEVKKQSRQIAETLVRKAAAGDLRGAEMLLSLIQKKNEASDGKKKTRTGPSLAELWASEPEWDESMEANSEVGVGGREPEAAAKP